MLIDQLKTIVGPRGWVTDPARLSSHLTEWRDTYVGKTPIMVMPSTTAEVVEIVKACAAQGTAIVPQGGNTGLSGGAIPDVSGRQILLSLSRMNAIRAICAQDFSITVDAGCVLSDVQAAACAADRFFPLSLAAEGSCQIGGNLATNAGGINVLKYGTARDQTLGLEVVLADGRVWDGLRSLRKDTAGYDLKQLFIGSEGTLGIITAACLKLYPRPQDLQTALLKVNSPSSAIAILARLRAQLADQLQAFELISERAIRLVCKHVPDVRLPFDEPAPWFVLLEASAHAGTERFQTELIALVKDGLASDAVVAKNLAEAGAMWRLRHSISEAQKREGASLKHDISVPIGCVGQFIAAAEKAVLEHCPAARVVAFGHVGDGNVHFNVSQPAGTPADAFLDERENIGRIVYDIADEFAGSISAEHGIGQLKRDQLRKYRSKTELNLMCGLKRTLDPQGILNPGKVL